MANTITNLIPDLYEGLDVVSRELTGFIPAVSTDNQIERVSLDDTVRVPQTQAQSAADNTPAAASPDTGDQTIENTTVTIDNSKHVPIRWNGEQQKGIKLSGVYSSILAQQTAQAIRTLVNLIETDIASNYLLSSRAYGTAGTIPFASSLGEAAQIKKILDDNGADMDRSLVIDTAAGVNLRSLTSLNQANAAGTTDTLRQGILLPLFGLGVRESAQVALHTAGTGASATTDNAGYAVGATVLTLASAGTGTILVGDVVSFAGDVNKYLVVSGDADVSGGGTITIAEPGLKVAMSAATKAITVQSDYRASMGFSRSAIHLATRMPALPDGGDAAIDSTIITDPNTGLSFEVALYPQFMQNVLHVRIAWGSKLIKPEHSALLLG